MKDWWEKLISKIATRNYKHYPTVSMWKHNVSESVIRQLWNKQGYYVWDDGWIHFNTLRLAVAYESNRFGKIRNNKWKH